MKIGVYYFSGTGNTAFIANYLNSKVKTLNNSNMKKYEIHNFDISETEEFDENIDLLIIGGPIYACNMPEKFIRWIARNIPENKNNTKAIIYSTSSGLKNAFGVDSVALKLNNKGYEIISKECFEMPNNFYFGKYPSHSDEEVEIRIKKAKERINIIISKFIIKDLENVKSLKITKKGVLLNDFYAELFSIMAKFMVKNYKVDDTCIACGKCVRNCPEKNIKLLENKIVYSRNCVMCTKCIHSCPVGAITYKGKKIKQYKRFL